MPLKLKNFIDQGQKNKINEATWVLLNSENVRTVLLIVIL